MDTFNPSWIPDQGMTSEDNLEKYIRRVQLGDGAVQTQKKVLGPIPQIFNCTFSGDLTKVNAIDVFVRSHHGQRFLWTPPGDAKPIRVICTKKSKTTDGVSGSVSVTFEQVVY